MSLERTPQTMNHYFEVMGGSVALTSPSFIPLMSPGPPPTRVRTYAARLRFATSLSPCTTTCLTPKRGGLSSRLDTRIWKATVSRHPSVISSRISYCVANDVVDDQIAAMRCYGPIVPMCP